jgi:hypothetical protein
MKHVRQDPAENASFEGPFNLIPFTSHDINYKAFWAELVKPLSYCKE